MAIEVRFGRFQLLRRIAQGGMAEVYLAQQTGPAGFSKQLVIKKIHPHLAHNEEFVGMFLDEARVAALLSHPNIGQIYASSGRSMGSTTSQWSTSTAATCGS